MQAVNMTGMKLLHFRPPDVSQGMPQVLPMNFLSALFLFLSIYRAQQPRSGWSSTVFLRFGRRQSFNNW